MITIRELAAWPLDQHPRPGLPDRTLHQPSPCEIPSAGLPVPQTLAQLLAEHQSRPDLHEEMTGLKWQLGLVDLTHLQSFQRRLTLPIPAAPPNTWPDLVALNFAQPRPPMYTATHDTLTTTDPNLTVSLSPLRIHTGSPFFEVATYRNRWFLRDGYHRAYALLRAGITQAPAVIIAAETLHQLNAAKPHFFPESILFSPRPPLVRDFLNDALNITYTRPPLIRTIRVTIETGEPT